MTVIRYRSKHPHRAELELLHFVCDGCGADAVMAVRTQHGPPAGDLWCNHCERDAELAKRRQGHRKAEERLGRKLTWREKQGG